MRAKVCVLFLLHALLVSIAVHAENSQSNISCLKDVITNLGEKDSVYTYKIEKKCTAETTYDIDELNGRYIDSINKDNDTDVISIKDGIKKEGLDGLKIQVKQQYQSEHGTLKVTGDLFLLDNKTSTFRYHFISNKISGSGHAKNTRSVNEQVEINKTSKTQFIISKTIKVKKPWIAPFYIFDSEVKKGLSKDMKFLLKRHGDLISK